MTIKSQTDIDSSDKIRFLLEKVRDTTVHIRDTKVRWALEDLAKAVEALEARSKV